MRAPQKRTLLSLACAAALLAAAPAQAQNYPNRPIRFIVPFAPGGSTDVSTRQLAAEMQPLLGQNVIVENRPGAAGGIGINDVARAEPDGYTIGASGVGPTILLNLTNEYTQYNTLRDLAFITHMNTVELVLAARKTLPQNDLKETLAWAKANPGKLAIGNTGMNGPVHLAGVLLTQVAGFDATHVPYKGDSVMVQDLLGGSLDTGIVSLPGATGQLKAGQLKPLAMLGAKRNATFPEVPTVAELGYPGYEASVFQIVVAPGKTPAPVIARLNEVANKALSSQKIRDDYAKLGMVATGGSPQDAAAFVKRETEKWSRVLERLGAKK